MRLKPARSSKLFKALLQSSPWAVPPHRSNANTRGTFFYITDEDKSGKEDIIGIVGIAKTKDGDRWLQYAVRPKYRKQGYASKAVKALMSVQNDPLLATVDERNKASNKILDKNGFQDIDRMKIKRLRSLGILEPHEKLMVWTLGKTKEAAKGIPDRGSYGDLTELSSLEGRLTPWVVQEHNADDAGKHYDLRIQGPQGAYSWASRKGLPSSPGTAHLAVRQPLHEKSYMDFSGKIEKGYGKGDVSIHRQGKISLNKIEKDKDGVKAINFSYGPGSGTPERFKLVKVKNQDGENQWNIINITPRTGPGSTGFERPKMKSVDKDRIEAAISKVSPENPVSVKIDGALNLVRLLKDRAEILSYRTSKDQGKPIYHTERVAPGLFSTDKELPDVNLWGEVYGEKGNKAIKPQEISGILNSSLENARNTISDKKIKMKMALIDIIDNEKFDEKEKKQIIHQVIEAFPGFFTSPERATSPEEAKKLLDEVISKRHPATEEGLVFEGEDGRVKYKPGKETEGVITKLYPGEGKYSDSLGSIGIALTPGGKEIARVGTGLDDETRKRLWEKRKEIEGKVLRFKYQSQFPSGSFRYPVFVEVREDYPLDRDRGVYWGQEIEKRMDRE
jgi:hypothetical protein